MSPIRHQEKSRNEKRRESKPFPRPFPRSINPKQPAFTLIELLVSMAVLAMLVVMLMSMVGSISTAWKTGVARVDNFSQARGVLGLIDRDIQSMVLRRDVGSFVDESGSNAFAFYTCFQAPAGNRILSQVQYKLDSTPKLLRYDLGFNFPVATGSSPLIAFSNPPANLPSLGTANSQELVEGVVGFGFQFLTSGTGNALKPSYNAAYQFDYTNPAVSTNTRAVVVSIAVLDEAAYRLAQQNGFLPQLITALSGTTNPGQSYAQLWNGLIGSGTFGTTYPRSVRTGLRTFERHISLPVTVVQ